MYDVYGYCPGPLRWCEFVTVPPVFDSSGGLGCRDIVGVDGLGCFGVGTPRYRTTSLGFVMVICEEPNPLIIDLGTNGLCKQQHFAKVRSERVHRLVDCG